MKKKAEFWSINKLRGEFIKIDFPEYQREPNIWSRTDKQRLIDSILRRFDIASLYFYKDETGGLSCIDGRQRINAIMSFLTDNPEDDSDNGFLLKVSNEIETDDDNQFRELDDYGWKDIETAVGAKKASAKAAVKRILEYKLTVVLLSGAAKPSEFNLQFTRLNLGTIINAGERLHAMVGEMRNLCFESDRIGKHPFLSTLSIPTRRFAKEQVAAQAIAQVFFMNGEGEFTRTRHVDLQRLFKRNSKIPEKSRPWIEELSKTFDALAGAMPDASLHLKNRAIAVSVVLFAWQQRMYEDKKTLAAYVKFLPNFLCRLRWQLAKGIDMDLEYRFLLTFQRHVTQAAVEKPAVKWRHKTIEEQFKLWLATSSVAGDAEFQKRTDRDPDELSREMILT